MTGCARTVRVQFQYVYVYVQSVQNLNTPKGRIMLLVIEAGNCFYKNRSFRCVSFILLLFVVVLIRYFAVDQ